MFSEKMLKQIIDELLEARSYEAENINDGLIVFKSYSMALGDIFYRLTGKELDLGQDLDAPDMEGF